MIVGNPYKFSICVSPIKEWNMSETYCNGVLILCVNGILFPNEIITAELKGELLTFKERLLNVTKDNELYNMQKEEAFINIYKMTFPNNIEIDNDYRFYISPPSLSDSDNFIFAVSNGQEVRIMASKLEYIIKDSVHNLVDINVTETFISIDELNQMLTMIDIC